MSRTRNIRWTLAITEPGDIGPYLYGVFTEEAQAEKMAATWQRVIRKRRPWKETTVTVVRIFPNTANFRDMHWPAR
jgi:hypothetical protein